MMKWLMVSAMALAFVASVFAQGDADKPPRVRGVVKEVKADAETLVVNAKQKDAEQSMSFVVKGDVVIKSGDEELKLKDIKVGDKVRVDYKEAEGKEVAVKIRVEND